jgi:hypothetical protein
MRHMDRRTVHAAPPLRGDLDDPGLTPLGVNDELGDSNRQREASRPGAARIDEENPFSGLDERAVRVTGKDCREPGRRRVEGELVDVMNDVDGLGSELDRVIGGERERPWPLVVVAADGAHGSHRPERIQHRRSPDVSTVDDEIGSAKPIDGFGPDQPVRVGDHTDDVTG